MEGPQPGKINFGEEEGGVNGGEVPKSGRLENSAPSFSCRYMVLRSNNSSKSTGKYGGCKTELQEKQDAKAAKFIEDKMLSDEEKRIERIEDWDRHQEGKGYRSKRFRSPAESTESKNSSKPRNQTSLLENQPVMEVDPITDHQEEVTRGGG
ncbi:hypothetical protein OS493_024184 [Desmophyllum pertusum]|uniref:Uncharacterized protein n=1 Tax=Desmophyllum pertusum TaxID=174260 RepID=A0A9W9ZBC1_9CNID|nr:hypothetical protein OS493_024184 [Desmophyllum pertusum]